MTSEDMKLTILGSGTSTGVPVPGCGCSVCTSDAPEDSRTRCSALLSYGGRNVLIDTSTDLRQQALREGLAAVDAVLYTHTHADHVHGIDDLRSFNMATGEAIPIYGSPQTITALARNFRYIFEDRDGPGYRPRLEARKVTAPFSLFGLSVVPLPLIHGDGPSLGYRIGAFAYLADCSAIPEQTEKKLYGLELLVIDALRFRPHPSHFNIPQALEVAARLRPRRTLLTHLSHDVDHRRDADTLPPGVELAWDGQCITLPLGRESGLKFAPHSP